MGSTTFRFMVETVTPTELAVGGLIAFTLDVDHPAPDQDFFALGGDENRAATLTIHINEVFRLDLGTDALFSRAPTVASIAQVVDDARLERRSRNGADTDGRERLAPVQERVWFIDRLEPGRPTYNHAELVRLKGEIGSHVDVD